MAKGESNLRDLANEFLKLVAEYDADGIESLFAEEIDWLVPGNPWLPRTGARTHHNQVAS